MENGKYELTTPIFKPCSLRLHPCSTAICEGGSFSLLIETLNGTLGDWIIMTQENMNDEKI